MLRKILISISLFAVSVPAFAQETHRWDGLYIGALGGYVWSDVDYPGAAPYPKGPPRPELDGAMIGGQIGYNFQFDSVVLGVEADGAWAHLSETLRDGNYLTESAEITSLGTVRARAGYAVGNWLPYVTGGFAWDRFESGFACPEGNAAPFGTACNFRGLPAYSRSDKQWNTGWALGGGVEYAINNTWSVKAEYLHLEFGDETYNYGLHPIGVKLPEVKIDHDVDVVKVGVNYGF